MKLSAIAAPLLIAALTVATLAGLGTLAVRAGAVSTRTNIELLRLDLRVARLQARLLENARSGLAAQAAAALPRGLRSAPDAAVAAVAADVTARASGGGSGETRQDEGSAPSVESPVRPWPEGMTASAAAKAPLAAAVGAAGAPATTPGQWQARAALDRLFGHLDSPLPRR
jgi:hypothetical protein